MSTNAAIIAVIIGISPSIVLAAVLLLVADQGRPKAIALALGWSFAIAVVAILSIVAAQDLHPKTGSSQSKFLDVADIVIGVLLLGAGIVTALRIRRAEVKEPKWLERLDGMPTYGAFLLGAFLPPYVLVMAGVSEIVRSDPGATDRNLAAVLFLIIGSIGAFTPVVVAFVSRDPQRVLDRWRTWVVANWRKVLVVILVVAGIYLVVKGVVEWTHDTSTSSTTPGAVAAYRPGA